MKDALINLLAIVLLICGGLMLMLGSLLGQQRRVGTWLVRGKRFVLRLFGEGA